MDLEAWTRRHFLRSATLAGLAALTGCPLRRGRPLVERAAPPRREGILGTIVGQDATRGHLLRSGALLEKPIAETVAVPILVIGSGISGLACAWRLRKAGVPSEDVRVLELESAPGGNARWGENDVSPFPWGAHYLRAPTRESRAVRTFLEDVKVIRGHDRKGRPDFDTRYVCAEPTERIFEGGVWGEGLFPPPRSGTAADKAELARFRAALRELAKKTDPEGRRPFAIPVEKSGRLEEVLALDRISFGAWLDAGGFASPALRWLLEYACRDDYGGTLATTSAWAGLHYFLARGLEDEDGEDEGVTLVWPEGNGWLARRLLEGARVEADRVVYRLVPDGPEALAWDPVRERAIRYRARRLVWAGPRFVLKHLLESPPEGLAEFQYVPWLAANLTLARAPGGVGHPLSWDNVLYESPSLGYVVATRGRPAAEPQVVTWYHAFAHEAPAEARARLLAMTWEQARDLCLEDLERAHPRLADLVTRLDVWKWGHAMILPRPGFVWGEARARAQGPIGKILTAHSDKGGISIFEEAFHQGARAGEEILALEGRKFESVL